MCILTPPFYQQKINVRSNFRAGSVNVGVNEVKTAAFDADGECINMYESGCGLH